MRPLHAALAFATVMPLFGACHEELCLYEGQGEGDLYLERYRNPETGQCEDYGYGGQSIDSCGNTPQTDPEPAGGVQAPLPDWALCDVSCEGLDEDTCLVTPGCRGAYLEDCPPNAGCSELSSTFYECWGVAPSGPIRGECAGLDAYSCSQHDDCVAFHLKAADGTFGMFAACLPEKSEPSEPDPGSCTGQVSCDVLPPNCPDGTVPGILNNCWSGYCIPIHKCEELSACGTLDESQCVSRTDCSPIYEGVDCTCDAGGCSCADWTFATCQ